MKLFRCYNPVCADNPNLPGHEFQADDPVCDKCKTDGRIPRFARIIVQLKIVHFEPASHVQGIGSGSVACGTVKPGDAARISGDPEAASCPACRKTKVWEEAVRAKSFNPEDDIPLEVDLKEQVLRKRS